MVPKIDKLPLPIVGTLLHDLDDLVPSTFVTNLLHRITRPSPNRIPPEATTRVFNVNFVISLAILQEFVGPNHTMLLKHMLILSTVTLTLLIPQALGLLILEPLITLQTTLNLSRIQFSCNILQLEIIKSSLKYENTCFGKVLGNQVILCK